MPGGINEGVAPHSSDSRKLLARRISPDCADRVTRPPIDSSPSEANKIDSRTPVLCSKVTEVME